MESFIKTNEIIVTIGNEIDLKKVSLNSILIYTNNGLITNDDILEITNVHNIETVESGLSSKILNDIINDTEGYICSYVNPLIIKIKFKNIMEIKDITLIVSDEKPDLSYQFMKIEYINNDENLGDDLVNIPFILEECTMGWHPINNIYKVNMRNEKIPSIEHILQNYVKKDEFNMWIMKNYQSIVNDIADRVVKIILNCSKKY